MSNSINTIRDLFVEVARKSGSVNLYKIIKTYIYSKFNPLGIDNNSEFWVLLEDYKDMSKGKVIAGKILFSEKYGKEKFEEYYDCRKNKGRFSEFQDLENMYIVCDLLKDDDNTVQGGKPQHPINVEEKYRILESFVSEDEVRDKVRSKAMCQRKFYFLEYCGEVLGKVCKEIEEFIRNPTREDLDILCEPMSFLQEAEKEPPGLLEEGKDGKYHVREIVFSDRYSRDYETFFNSNPEIKIFTRNYTRRNDLEKEKKFFEDLQKKMDEWKKIECNFCERASKRFKNFS